MRVLRIMHGTQSVLSRWPVVNNNWLRLVSWFTSAATDLPVGRRSSYTQKCSEDLQKGGGKDSTPLGVSEVLLCPHSSFLLTTWAKELWPELKQLWITFLKTWLAGWGHMQPMKEACDPTSSLLEIHFDCGSRENPSMPMLKPAHTYAFLFARIYPLCS